MRTGEDLCSALTRATPGSDATRRAVDELMGIFKTKAVKEQTPTNAQRVRKVVVHAQMVASEADNDTKLQGTTATAELTDYEQSTGDASDDDNDASTCPPVRAATDDDDDL